MNRVQRGRAILTRRRTPIPTSSVSAGRNGDLAMRRMTLLPRRREVAEPLPGKRFLRGDSRVRPPVTVRWTWRRNCLRLGRGRLYSGRRQVGFGSPRARRMRLESIFWPRLRSTRRTVSGNVCTATGSRSTPELEPTYPIGDSRPRAGLSGPDAIWYVSGRMGLSTGTVFLRVNVGSGDRVPSVVPRPDWQHTIEHERYKLDIPHCRTVSPITHDAASRVARLLDYRFDKHHGHHGRLPCGRCRPDGDAPAVRVHRPGRVGQVGW